MSNIFKYIFVFVGLTLFQTLVLNNINISGVINPYIYLLFILLLPFEISGWLLLLLSFLTGISIDLFTGTIGMHAFSAVMVGGLRPLVISLISQKGQDLGKYPSIENRGFSWMILYIIILTLLHHFVYFSIESWSAGVFGFVIFRIILSTVMSVFIIVLLLYAFKSSDKK